MNFITRNWTWLAIGIGLVLIYKFVDRQSLMEVINYSLPGEEAGVLRGILLGDKTGMSRELANNFKNSGLIHLMVASGSNVTLLSSGIIEAGAKWLGRKRAIVGGMALIWGYAAMTGWEAPIVRALLLISVYYWAQLLGRKFNLVRGLAVAVGMMLLAAPGMASELSFWLSLTAFVGLVSHPFKMQKGSVGEAVVITGWISLWTWPVLAVGLGKVSLVGPMSNGAVMLVTEIISLVGTLGLGVGLIWQEAGRLILWLTLPLLHYLTWVGNSWGEISPLMVSFNIYMAAGWYLVLVYWLARRSRERRWKTKKS